MAKKTKLVKAAATIGTALGRAERVARNLAASARQTTQELAKLKKLVRELDREAARAKKRFKRALR
ncbi:MAG TPA: hypothetical protein VLT85_10385 [Terriglobales bacterium]|nr:hypothetical protein [Terriglobales bacterium]